MKTDFIYAFRNIRKNSTNSLITIFGLSVAIACSLIIFLFVNQEYNYNKFHKNADRIFRINYSIKYIDNQYKDVRVEPELINILKKQIPQIEYCAEYRSAFSNVLEYNNNFFDAQMGVASEDYFKMFSFEFIAGNKKSIFTKPNEIVITKQFANKIFAGNKDYRQLLGKAIRFPLNFGKTGFTVVGILDDIPKNSTMNFDAIISGTSDRNFGGCENYFGYTSVYYMGKTNTDKNVTSKNVKNVVENYYKERVKSSQDINQIAKTNDAFVPFMLSLKDVYTSEVFSCSEKSVSEKNFIVLIIIGGLILIIACFNYTILSLGQYLKRIGDIGIRKVVGAKKLDIFKIFLSEGIILTSVAFLVGGILCNAFIPVFSTLSDSSIFTSIIEIRQVILFIILLFICIVFLTSIIPVIVFLKVSPSQMAGKKINIGHKNILSQVFVSFQYSASIILIIVTIFIAKQGNYLKSQPLGFNSSNVLNINISRFTGEQRLLFKKLLAEHPGVINLSLTDRNFIDGEADNYVNKDNGDQISAIRFIVDHDYISTLGLHLIKGSSFSLNNETPNDRSIIVNETFVKALGIEDNPIGKSYAYFGVYCNIIGVVSDYHFFDMRTKISPAVLMTRQSNGGNYNTVLMRYDPQKLTSLLKHAKKCYEKLAPGKPFEYTFWDASLKQRYQAEDRWSNVIGYSSLIAIIISSLGLFGFTILLINQRFKEIGIRKVNGATTLEVMMNISQSFFGWLIGSIIISFPIAYLIVVDIFSNYANRVDISWWVFIVAGIIALSIAMLTVSYQTWRAAKRNPVEALKNE